MKILNSDSQCVFRIKLVEKLQFVRPYWNILFEITYESKLTKRIFMRIIALLPVSKFYENLHAQRSMYLTYFSENIMG